MRKTLFAALVAAFALLCPIAATAAALTASGSDPKAGISGSLVTAADFVRLRISGTQYATVKWRVVTAGTATVTAQYSKDEETNWLTPPYSGRIDAVYGGADLSMAPWANNGPVAGTYETPLPGNAEFFQIACGTTGTATKIFIYAGKPYVPGEPVVATLYDVTTGAGLGNDTGILDTSGWTSVSQLAVFTFGSAGAAWTSQTVDDAGTGVGMTASASLVVNTTTFGGYGPGTSNPLSPTQLLPLPKRLRVIGTVGTGSSWRFRLEARRGG